MGGARTTPQAPGGSHPPNTGTGHTRARSHTATDRLAGDGHRISPPPDGHGERGWTATRHGGPAPWGEAEPGGEGTPPPHRPDRPDPKADGRPPLGVFKPPRRDALGTWREGGGRGGAGRGESAAPRRPQRPPALTTGNELRPSRGPPSERGSYVALTARDAGATRPPADHRPHRKAAPPPPPRAGREGPGQAAAGSEQWSGGMEDQRPGAPHRAKEGLGCLLLPVHWCFAGGHWTWKPTPNVLYFREEVDGARICLVCKGPTTSSFYR